MKKRNKRAGFLSALLILTALPLKVNAAQMLEKKTPEEKKVIEESKYTQDIKFGDEARVYNKYENLYAVPASGEITSPFGWRFSPTAENTKFHYGIDIANDADTDVCAVKKGIVVYTQDDHPGYGQYIKVQHEDGSLTLYAHLMSIEVKEGDIVKKGQRIGGMGTTGASTGVHLHFELVIGGENVDPMSYIFESYNMEKLAQNDGSKR